MSIRRQQDDALALLDAADRGEVRIVAGPEQWARTWAGDVEYRFDGGGRAVVFQDCGDWDYVDYVELPSGEVVDGFGADEDGEEAYSGWRVGNWKPTHRERWCPAHTGTGHAGLDALLRMRSTSGPSAPDRSTNHD